MCERGVKKKGGEGVETAMRTTIVCVLMPMMTTTLTATTVTVHPRGGLTREACGC